MHVPQLLRRPVDAVRRWPVDSQLGARRNALIASTALAQRRAELEEVQELLAVLGEAPMPEVAAPAANG
jgi:N-dimethylarginine dimethylaminohydrolase